MNDRPISSLVIEKVASSRIAMALKTSVIAVCATQAAMTATVAALTQVMTHMTLVVEMVAKIDAGTVTSLNALLIDFKVVINGTKSLSRRIEAQSLSEKS